MTKMFQYAPRTRRSVYAAPSNCEPCVCDADASEKIRKRCPNCNQFHLRPGYCQALDPANADKYPHLHQSHEAATVETESHENETETVFAGDESQPWVLLGISRATYFRRRAEKKT